MHEIVQPDQRADRPRAASTAAACSRSARGDRSVTLMQAIAAGCAPGLPAARKATGGFTLVEIMVVMAIIANPDGDRDSTYFPVHRPRPSQRSARDADARGAVDGALAYRKRDVPESATCRTLRCLPAALQNSPRIRHADLQHHRRDADPRHLHVDSDTRCRARWLNDALRQSDARQHGPARSDWTLLDINLCWAR